jgi:hypothetical protein
MQRRSFVLGLALAAATLAGCETMSSSSSALTNSLTSGLGVTQTQAQAGVGSVLSYAKDRLSTTDFNAVAKSIPGADSYMQAAYDKFGPAKIADRAGLNSALTRLGMTPEQVNKFVPAVSDYVAKQGGDYAKNLLLGAMR